MVVQQEENPYHYTGIHAFGFLRGAAVNPGEVVATIRRLGRPPEGPVIWAGSFVGEYYALAHVRVEPEAFDDLQALIEGDLWDAGFRGRWAVEDRVAQKTDQNAVVMRVGVKRGTQEIIAVSALSIEPGSLDAVLEQVVSVEGFRGASVVFGDADVLVQLGGERFGEVAAAVEGLQGVEGIVAASTAFCDGRR